MHNLIRFYNQNRRRVWIFVLIILSFFLLIRVLNYIAIKNNERTQNNTTKSINVTDNNTVTEVDKYTSDKSAVKGSSVQKSKLNQAQELLDSFFENCNNKNLETAYNLLTDECKETVYPTLEAFQNNYYNNMFEGKEKIYSFENWHSDTYYITLKEDLLKTGSVNTSENIKNDYITIVGDKLNIRSFVGSYELGKKKEENKITIEVKNKQTFIDYEIYNLNIKNDSDKTICLSTGEDSKDIYIQDKNDVKYGVVNNEIINSKMYVEPGTSTNLSFKFYSSYVQKKEINKLVFKNINLEANSEEQKNMYEFKINL